jgi:hypothetical protein
MVNSTLQRFLDAFAASIEGIEYVYANGGQELPEQPTWRILAELLVMATAYE